MPSLFPTRSQRQEWMDSPVLSPQALKQALQEIQWVNRHLNGTRVLLQALAHLIGSVPQCHYSVLDLGTGSADIPIAMVQWGEKRGIGFEVVALDNNTIALAFGKEVVGGYPEITLVEADAMRLDYPPNRFDFVTCSMFLHHLPTSQAVVLLQHMARIARIGFIVNDLERHFLAYWGIRLLGKLTAKSPVFQHDAPLSVLRGFTIQELKHLGELAGLSGLQVYRRFPFRIVAVWEKQPRAS